MSSLDLSIDGKSDMELNVLDVKATYETLTISSKVTGADGKIPEWLFGRNALYNNSGPPSFVWVPSTETLVAPANIGGGSATDEDGAAELDRAINDRIVAFDVYCNGRGYQETENLIKSVIAAVRQLGVENVPEGIVWTTEQESNHDESLNFIQAVLTVNLRIPVVDEESALTTVDFQEHTEDIDTTLEC